MGEDNSIYKCSIKKYFKPFNERSFYTLFVSIHFRMLAILLVLGLFLVQILNQLLQVCVNKYI